MRRGRAPLEDLVDLLRDLERFGGVEAQRLLQLRDLLRAERRPVGVGGILFRRCAEADVRRGDDQNGLPLHVRGPAVGAVNRLKVVAVHGEDFPAVALETLFRVVVHRERDVALDGDAVRVVDEDEVVQAHRARPRANLVRDALLHVAVAAEDPRLVGDGGLLRRKREADAHGDALPQGARRHLDAGQEAALRVTRATRTPLAERLQVVHRHLAHAGQVKERVDERGGVAARKDETVAAGEEGVFWIDIEMLQPEDARQIRKAERRAGMAGVRFFNHVRRETTDRRGDQFVFVKCSLHLFDNRQGEPLKPAPPIVHSFRVVREKSGVSQS